MVWCPLSEVWLGLSCVSKNTWLKGKRVRAFVFCLFTVHLVDIWNVIEAFRENGLNTMDLNTEFTVARLEAILSTIFYQLNKRMPTTHQINVEQSISMLLNFLLAAYDPWVSTMTASLCDGHWAWWWDNCVACVSVWCVPHFVVDVWLFCSHTVFHWRTKSRLTVVLTM